MPGRCAGHFHALKRINKENSGEDTVKVPFQNVYSEGVVKNGFPLFRRCLCRLRLFRTEGMEMTDLQRYMVFLAMLF